MRSPVAIAGALLLQILSAESAFAQIGGVIDAVGGGLPAGGGSLIDIVHNLILTFRIRELLAVVGVLIIVRSAIYLITEQKEDQLANTKRTIGATMAGIMLMYLVEPLWGAFSPKIATGDLSGAGEICGQITGIVQWANVLAAIVAITFIIVSGILAVTSYGGEETATQLRKTVFASAAGLLLLGFGTFVNRAFGIDNCAFAGTVRISELLSIIFRLVAGLLSFAALAAVCVIVYAGIVMILNMGNEDQFSKAKSLIIRACIGLVVILLSLTLAVFVTGLVVPSF